MTQAQDLSQLLDTIEPRLHEGVYVFCEVPTGSALAGLDPQLLFREDDATTLVLAQEQAESVGLAGEFPSAWITLGANSDLAAVGFLAAVTPRLAAAGISSNVVSAYCHDHLFVPVAEAGEAMTVLSALGASRRPVRMVLSVEGERPDRTVEIRPARVSDAEALQALWELCGLRFENKHVVTELQSCIRLHGELVLVATREHEIVGSIWATYDGRRGWVQRLATHPAQRRRGIGGALMASAEDRLTGLGVTKVNLLVDSDNAGVVPFYERLGYKSDGLTFMEHWLEPRPSEP